MAKKKAEKKEEIKVVDVKEPSKYSFWAILALIVGILISGWLIYQWLKPESAGAIVQSPCEEFCDDWNYNHTYCEDWDYRLCHINPSHPQNLSFNNLSSCQNHLGTPHNQSTYDLRGLCPAATPTPSPTLTPTPTPTETPAPTPTPPVCDEEYSCQVCSEKPNDDWCGEYKFDFCQKEYGCEYVDDEWSCECPVEPTPTPTPEVTPTPNPQSESKPEGCTANCGVPACTDKIPEPIVNPHVYRNGDVALVKWYPKEGNRVNIYYRLNAVNDWQHSVQVDNTGYFEVKNLGSEDWTFGLQSVNGCSADGIVNASIISEVVDGVSNRWILFR